MVVFHVELDMSPTKELDGADIGIKDVSAEFWQLVDAVNALCFEDLCATPIFINFQGYVERGFICMMRAHSMPPLERIADMPEGCWYAPPLESFMFSDVNRLFHGVAEMYAEVGDNDDPRRSSIIACMKKIGFKLDLDEMQDDICNLTLHHSPFGFRPPA